MSKRKIKYLELKWIWLKLNKKLNVDFKKKKKNLKIHEKILPGKAKFRKYFMVTAYAFNIWFHVGYVTKIKAGYVNLLL